MNPIRCIPIVCILALLPLPARTANVAPGQKLQLPAQKKIGAPKLVPKPAPKAGGPPYNLVLPAFTVTGTGAAETRAAFSPKHATLPEFTVTGTGAPDARASFSPKSVTL